MMRTAKKFFARLILKTFSSICLVLVIGSLLISLIGFIYEENSHEIADSINSCEGYYYERDFAGLYETLTLYDLYSAEFSKYWEAVDAYQAYTDIIEWQKAAAMGMDGAEEKARQAKDRLSDMRTDARHPQNAAMIDALLDAV